MNSVYLDQQAYAIAYPKYSTLQDYSVSRTPLLFPGPPVPSTVNVPVQNLSGYGGGECVVHSTYTAVDDAYGRTTGCCQQWTRPL
jgi:hypothetical protein